jgi:hypothetical protein
MRRVAGLTAAGIVAVTAGLTSPATGAANGSNTCPRSAIDVPSCGVLWGMFRPRVSVAGHHSKSARYPAVEKQIGRRFDIVKTYTDWQAGDTFPFRADKRLAAGGRTLYYSWNAVNYDTNRIVTYASIARGDYDSSVIIPEAQKLKAYKGKVFLDFNHEFDAKPQASKGTPAQFAAAYRHIWTVFKDQGVTNVIWVWVTTGWTGNSADILAGYPGASYVDWIGYDPYSLGSCAGRTWHSTYDSFDLFYSFVSKQTSMDGKPLMLSEYAATATNPAAKSWYASIPKTLKKLPRIKALVQYSDTSPTGCDVTVTDSKAALAGYKKAANSPVVTGS